MRDENRDEAVAAEVAVEMLARSGAAAKADRVTVDRETRVAYVRLTGQPMEEGIAAQTHEVTAFVDVDADGRVLGIEILDWPAAD